MPDEFPLSSLAAKASDNPFFFGHWLRLYATRQTLTNEALAQWLGCSLEVLQKVRLCRAPANRDEAKQIAEKFGLPAMSPSFLFPSASSVERICEVMGW